MTRNYKQFIKDINNIDLEDICSDWQWLLNNEYLPVMVSMSGDMFLSGKNGEISRLDTGKGRLEIVAQSLNEFINALEDTGNIEDWLLPSIVLNLIQNGLLLKENEIYSYRILPILHGDYSLTNFEVANIYVHFSITGQICKQLKELPDGTKIAKISFVPHNH